MTVTDDHASTPSGQAAVPPPGCPMHQVLQYPFGEPVATDLHQRYAEVREEQALTRVDMSYGGEAWLATRHADIKQVLADPRFSRAATVGKDVPRVRKAFEEQNIVSMDDPEHARLRKLVAKAFTVRRVEQIRPRAQQIADELLDKLLASTDNTGDLAAQYAWMLPITVICEMLDVPLEDHYKFRGWIDTWLTIGDEHTLEEMNEARFEKLPEYMSALLAKRRAEPGDDLLSALVAARDEEDRLSEEELITMSIALLATGHHTTANQLANHLYILLSRREEWERLVAEPELLPTAIEELLRVTPLSPYSENTRIALEDVEVGGQLVKAGEGVMVFPAVANRDPRVFERPEELDLTRAHNPHIAFGHGIHHCLGAPLARLELQVALGTLLRRLPGVELAVPAEEVPWKRDHVVRGVAALPVRW
ncbi:cytochrome P450 [Streptomyces sp. NBC_00882]|uniref:cytochrome P450 n=1 Tax=Streptomyces TaxID=1883 RepID=UPI003865DAAF|nr:cytochrome P450 [Streptomyces canus]WSZ30957.1 cytochrome P450 [Streptomyces sp. NBC_00882]WSZ57807.1 cytochrome P450 [Streptomyces canus]